MTVRLFASACLLVIACAKAGPENPGVNDGPQSDGPVPDSTPDANNCVTQPCDILTECGCPSAQACDIDDDDLMGTACRPVAAGASDEGGGCSDSSKCTSSNVCLGNPGICRHYCDANTDCGSPRGQCLITITDGTNPIPGAPKTCTSNCDPTNVAAGGCPSTMKCSLFVLDVNGVDTNIVDCDTAGAGVQGANCTTNNAADDSKCAKDFLCVTTGGTTNTCRRTCEVGGANVCTTGTCTAFTTPFIVGGKNYGFCP